MQSIYQIIYISRAHAGLPAAALSAMVTASRQHNAERGIHGALVFDGEAFAHWLQGDAVQVRELFGQIAIDPRHERLVVLREGEQLLPPDLVFSRWRAGWAPPDSVAVLLASNTPERTFQQLLASCDLE